VLGQKDIDPRGLVRREVVGDHVSLFAPRLTGHDVDQECNELCRGMAGNRLPKTSPVLVLNAAYSDSVP
jgi:hypothetical protein